MNFPYNRRNLALVAVFVLGTWIGAAISIGVISARLAPPAPEAPAVQCAPRYRVEWLGQGVICPVQA